MEHRTASIFLTSGIAPKSARATSSSVTLETVLERTSNAMAKPIVPTELMNTRDVQVT